MEIKEYNQNIGNTENSQNIQGDNNSLLNMPHNTNNKFVNGIIYFVSKWWILCLLLILSVFSIALSISNIIITDGSIVITFIGILATFVVISNYMQVVGIKKDFDENKKELILQIKSIEKTIDEKIEKSSLSNMAYSIIGYVKVISYTKNRNLCILLSLIINAIELINKSGSKRHLDDAVYELDRIRYTHKNKKENMKIPIIKAERYKSILIKTGDESVISFIDFIDSITDDNDSLENRSKYFSEFINNEFMM
jgi:hypothetical protein